MIAGNIYGVVLNDSDELVRLGDALNEKPYTAPPKAPVVYMKPRSCVSQGKVAVPTGEPLTASPTLAILFKRDVSVASPDTALDAVGGAMLALDLMRVTNSYYRPTIAERNGDGFLPLGEARSFTLPDEIVTYIGGAEVHRWSLSRLARPVAQLVSDLSQFMTLKGGDVLLVGLPGDAPVANAGQTVQVQAHGFATLEVVLQEKAA
ncbi:fumarylacetoacetate hydrolase family protein [Sphingobium sp. H39-3-25]|uniref:fumarylacetoacetate hydrolase family protein n=1 Tax=Sphingobium arseniciresistens TaxID=3030834 RepID=UPI0023B96EBB|nr:fumarylacetoacetate hydrolase family protein [Sphingobium arseniciresistens]